MGGKTSAKSKNDWIAKAYDRINLTVPKGKKEVIQEAAKQNGESVNALINRLIDAELERLGIEAGGGSHFGKASGDADM